MHMVVALPVMAHCASHHEVYGLHGEYGEHTKGTRTELRMKQDYKYEPVGHSCNNWTLDLQLHPSPRNPTNIRHPILGK
jgi:hypothetical protein